MRWTPSFTRVAVSMERITTSFSVFYNQMGGRKHTFASDYRQSQPNCKSLCRRRLTKVKVLICPSRNRGVRNRE